MKGWDSTGCKNLYIKNFIKPSTSENVESFKGDTSSLSTKTNDSNNSSQHMDSPIIQKKQSQSPKIQSSLSTATGSDILKSVRTYGKKNISLVKHNGKLDSGTEKLPTNIDSDEDNYSKSYNDVHSNEIDSFNSINGDSANAREEDDFRYSLYYYPSDKSSSDDEKFNTFSNKNSCSSSNEFEHSAKELKVSKIVNDNGYQRTRKNMKKHLAKQKSLSMSDAPKVEMPHSDISLSKGNVSKKQVPTGDFTFSEEVTRNGFQHNMKNLKKINLLEQNKLESDPESNVSEVTKLDPESKTSKVMMPPDPNNSFNNVCAAEENELESASESNTSEVTMRDPESKTSKVMMLPNYNESFNNVCAAEEENSTHDLSTTVSKVHITNIDSKGVSTVLRREASDCNLPTKKKKTSLPLAEKKMSNRCDSKCDLPVAKVPNCNSTSNNTVMENLISSSGEKVQTKQDVSNMAARSINGSVMEGLRRFTQSKNNQSCFSDIHDSSLKEKVVLSSSYLEDNSQSSEESEKSYCGSQKSEELEDCASCDSEDSTFICGTSSETENNMSDNSLSKYKEKNKRQPRKRTKLESYGTMKVKSRNKGTSESLIPTFVTKPSTSTSSIVSTTSVHPTYEQNSCFTPVALTESLNSTPSYDSCAPKIMHAGSKVKKINIPVMYCDFSEADSGNPFLPVLTSQVNKFSSTIISIGKRDPKILQSIDHEKLKKFHDSVEWLSGLSEIEIACELCPNPPESMPDDSSQNDLYEQFMRNALNSPEQCTCEMLETLICDLDARDLLFKVRQFCTSPKVVQFAERFFAGFEEFPLSSPSEVKVQFHFPEDFENQPFQAVVKDYVRLLAHKIWPKEAKTIKGQFVIEFAQQNLSTVEVFIVSNFFKKSELLTKQTFISRLTYVAAFSVYKFYTRMVDE